MIVGLPLQKATTGKGQVLSKLLPETGALFIHDTETRRSKTIAIKDLLANHHTKSVLDALVHENVTAMICMEIFALGYKVIKEKGIEVFKAETFSLEENISLFIKKELMPFSFRSAKTNGCSSNCSSCGDSQCRPA